MIELLCPHCGFRKSIFISELVDMDTCPLCDNILMNQSGDISCKLDNDKIYEIGKDNQYNCQCSHPNLTKDNYCFSCNKFRKENNLKKENEEYLKEIDRIDDKLFGIMSNLYFDEIKEYGHQRIWDNLNFLPLEKRLWHIELYFQALYQIELEQKLMDNGMTPYNEE